MRSTISLITAASLVLHLGLGCCAHHAHAHDEHSLVAMALDHDHDTDEHSMPDEESEGEHEGCREPSCVYVGGAKIIVAKDLTPLADTSVATDVGATLHRRTTPTGRIETDTGQVVPIRLHLYYQILLI